MIRKTVFLAVLIIRAICYTNLQLYQQSTGGFYDIKAIENFIDFNDTVRAPR